MSHSIGMSGSTILTDPKKFSELFQFEHVRHIEIGEFPDEAAFQDFLDMFRKKKMSFGLHSPLFRNKSKYDLLEKVQFEPDTAWKQFAAEVERMSQLGAEYVLVHFPYFKKETTKDTDAIIEHGLRRLKQLQEQFSIPIVCEPKLGMNCSPFGIQALDNYPIHIWEKYGINLCIDIGDYQIATGDAAIDYIKKWQEFIKVVHLHNVEFQNDQYFWVPIHPSHDNPSYFHVREMIEQLAKSPDVFFVLEHTPHSQPTVEFVNEGIEWLMDLIDK